MTVRPTDGIPVYSNSEMQTWKRCRRKWWLAYYRHLGLAATRPTGPLALGTRIHRALAEVYKPNPGDPMVMLEKTILEDLELFDEEAVEIEKEAELARIMLEGYIEWVAETGVDHGLTIVGAEQRVEVESGIPGVRLVGKLDVRVTRDSDRVQLFLDHKTVQNLTEPVRTLHLDEQMLHYHLLEYMEYLRLKAEAQRDGTPEPAARHTDGGLYNMLRKVKRTDRAKPPFYDRVEVRHNINELRAYWIRAHAVVETIENARKALDAGANHLAVAFPTPHRNCTWDCEFFAVCPMFDDGSNAEGLLETYYVAVDPLARYGEEEGSADA